MPEDKLASRAQKSQREDLGSEARDWWDKAKIISGAALSLLGLMIPIVYHIEEQAGRKSQNMIEQRKAAYQMITDRERYEMEFRGRNFEPLLNKVLDHRLPIGERIATLNLFYENFPGRFNPRVFFNVLGEEARVKPDPVALQDLKSLAYRMAKNEEALVEVGSGRTKPYPTEWVSVGSMVQFHLESLDPHSHAHEVQVTLDEIRDSGNVVLLSARFPTDKVDVPEQFQVSFYDTPFTDNTFLPDGHRFAITLKETATEKNPGRARLKVLEFPSHYIVTGDRPTAKELDEMIGETFETTPH